MAEVNRKYVYRSQLVDMMASIFLKQILFQRTGNSGHSRMLPHVSGSQKSKMADLIPEVHVSQLVLCRID